MTETPRPPAVPGTVVALYLADVRPRYAFIYSKVGNRAAAEDLTINVFLKAAARHDMIGYDHGMGRPDRQAGRGLASVTAAPIAVQGGCDV